MFSVVLFPSAQHRDNEMDHMFKHGKWENMEKQLNKTNAKVGSPLLASGSKKTELVPQWKPWDSSCCINNNNK